MEPDLDRLVDFVSGGRMFPQFSASWATYFARACNLRSEIKSGSKERIRVVIRTVNEESFTALFLSLCRTDIDLFLFNPRWGRNEQGEAMAIAEPHLVLGDFNNGQFAQQRMESGSRHKTSAEGLRVMIPTGGTSGAIRFAVHNWSTLSASAYGFQSYFSTGTVRSLCVLPLYHVSGFMQLIRSILCVGQIVFARTETFAEGHALLFEESSDDCFLSVVPTQLERLLRDQKNFERLRTYQAIFVGGGPCPIGLIEECRKAKLPLALTYGMTETAAQVATLKPNEFLSGESSVGRLLPHVAVKIVDEGGEELENGDIGRIQISTSALFKGYYSVSGSDPSNVILTSDLGYINERGCLKVMGRRDRVIISGGEKINLREVELVFEDTGLVRDVVAFGLEDREWGMKLGVAYVPTESFVTEQAIKESIKGKLTNYKEPKVCLRRTALPRNEAGKLLMEELLQGAGQG
ncbi:AMP-binding protein [Puniceicoccaceae bacterium K14]|nr:AMP-binding protein [Puniceicoccaceae bacterium K14]